MKAYKYLILGMGLLCTMLVNLSYAIADETVAMFTFGKIEVLKADAREWRFLEKGMALTADDLVRMPPFSLIRLKVANDTLLPTLSGGREVTVNALIDEGLQRKNAIKGKRINENLDGSPAIDVLPLGNKQKTETHIPDGVDAIRVSPQELEILRRQLDSLAGAIADSISPLPFQGRAIPSEEAVYPGPRLELARTLYQRLTEFEDKTPNAPRPLLYAQLLRHTKIDADLVTNDKGELFVTFDSGLPLDSAKRITANQQLIDKRPGKDTAWISVSVQSPRQNFVTAWYQASRR